MALGDELHVLFGEAERKGLIGVKIPKQQPAIGLEEEQNSMYYQGACACRK